MKKNLGVLLLALTVGSVGVNTADAKAVSYKVVKGDTLYHIGKKVGVDYREIKELNHLKTDLIHPGQVLKLKASSGVKDTNKIVKAKVQSKPKAVASSGGQNWEALAWCESRGNARVVDATGTYHGLYQFDVRTWRGVGGKGLPSQASPAEQTKRAKLLYAQRGSQPWPVCGKYL